MRRPTLRIVVACGAAAWLLLSTACRGARQAPRSIVLITIDTLRADSVTARLMPTLDALGRQAVVFDQAVTVAPLTLPAHASLLTAAYPPHHAVRDNQGFALPDDVSTLPMRLKARGYATGAFVSAVVLDHRSGLNRGFDVYDDEIQGPERPAVQTLARAERWVDAAHGPFFLWVHLFEPHAPYRTGSYEGEVRQVDQALADFFAHLRVRQGWNDLVVSVTADHGESLGEHGERTHGFFVYDSTLRIPWILKAPGLPARRVPFLVRIVDELPTVLDVAGVALERDSKPPSDGLSVRPFLGRNGLPGLEAYGETFLPLDQFGWSALRSIWTERWEYIDAPEPELYDREHDPHETTNLFASHGPEAARLGKMLTAIAQSPRPQPKPAAADPALAERLMALGYVGYLPEAAPADERSRADPKAKLPVYNLAMAALELSERGDVNGALDKLKAAEQLDSTVAQIEFLKGNLLGRVGRYAEAVAALERTVALDPAYTAARFKLALALLRTGRPDLAAEGLDEVVRQQPGNFRAWHNLATIAYSRGDLDRADALERKALALSPDYAEAWNALGAIALVQKRVDSAIEALTRATELDPRNAQAYQNLALALRASGRKGEARAASQRACALDPRFCATTGGRP